MKKDIQKNKMTYSIKEKAYLLNFIKFIDKQRLCPDEEYNGWKDIEFKLRDRISPGEEKRIIIKCLNQYDVIRISEIKNDVTAVDTVLNQSISSFCLTDRRFLCFAIKEENYLDELHEIFHGNNFISVILIKLNNLINNKPFLEESKAVELFKNILNKNFSEFSYFILRTFANKELFIILNIPKLSDIERLVGILQNVIISKENSKRAFPVVNRWICSLGPLVNDTSFFNGTLKLYGVCRQSYNNKYKCLSNFPPLIKENVRLRGMCCNDDEVIKSICFVDEENNRKQVSVNEVVQKIFSSKCCEKNYCAVSLNILLSKDKEAEKKQYLLYENGDCKISNLNYSDYFKKFQPFESLQIEGLKFHFVELSKLRKFVEKKLRNLYQKTEYEDLLILFEEIYRIIEQDIEDRKRQGIDERLRKKLLKQNLGLINIAVQIMEYVCKERERPTICSSWYDDGFYKTNISGFSRISNAANFLIETVANRDWCNDSDTHRGICTFGYLPSYGEYNELSAVNVAFQALLSPKHFFGIFHEIGHIIQYKSRSLSSKIDSFKIKYWNRDEQQLKRNVRLNENILSEIFSDLFSNFYGIPNLTVYRKENIKSFIDNMIYDKLEYFSENSNAVDLKCQDQLYRLFAVTVANKFLTADIAFKRILNRDTNEATYTFIKDQLIELKDVLFTINSPINNEVSNSLYFIAQGSAKAFTDKPFPALPDSPDYLDEKQLEEKQQTFYDIYGLTRELIDTIFLNEDMNFKNYLDFSNDGTDYQRLILNESKFYTGAIDRPESIIFKALESNLNSFSSSVATILSFGEKYSRENYLNFIESEVKIEKGG